jgi:hypothetical protein
MSLPGGSDAQPDASPQEVSQSMAFPREVFEDRGYNVELGKVL